MRYHFAWRKKFGIFLKVSGWLAAVVALENATQKKQIFAKYWFIINSYTQVLTINVLYCVIL